MVHVMSSASSLPSSLLSSLSSKSVGLALATSSLCSPVNDVSVLPRVDSWVPMLVSRWMSIPIIGIELIDYDGVFLMSDASVSNIMQ